MDVEVDPDWGAPAGAQTAASDQGAGNLGFAGTARKETAARGGGLDHASERRVRRRPRMPMVPGTWDPNGAADGGEETHDG